MLSVTLLAGILVCLAVPPLHIWAGPLVIALFFVNSTVLFGTLAVSVLTVIAYLYREYR